jgi:nitrate reductase assembly molybdenum cofactor insertion protein NarJ
VLRSDRAVQVDIELIRSFVRLRRVLVSHADLARKLAEAETKHEAQYPAVFEAIRQLMDTPAPAKRRIGFETEETD